MSHKAMSMPEMTWTMIEPPRMSRCERNSFCQRCSTRVGFSPSSSSKSDSARTAATFGSQPVTSPQPTTFLSVSILRKVLGPQGMPRRLVILMLAPRSSTAARRVGGDGAGQREAAGGGEAHRPEHFPAVKIVGVGGFGMGGFSWGYTGGGLEIRRRKPTAVHRIVFYRGGPRRLQHSFVIHGGIADQHDADGRQGLLGREA